MTSHQQTSHYTSQPQPATSSPVPNVTSHGLAQTPYDVTSSTLIGPVSLQNITHMSGHDSLTTRGDQVYQMRSGRAVEKLKRLVNA